jgi:hypothetical protein
MHEYNSPLDAVILSSVGLMKASNIIGIRLLFLHCKEFYERDTLLNC